MNQDKLIKELHQLRALGQLVVERSYNIEKELGLVQAPTPRKGKGIDMSKAVATIISRRNAKLKKVV